MVKTSWLAAAGLTVSFCVAEPTPLVEAVIVGVPAEVSVYWKLAVLAPAGIVSGETGVNVPFAEVVLRVTVNALPASTGLPKASSSATVIVLEATPAVSVCGELVNANWLAAAGLTVSFCVAEPTPPIVAVMVGVPAAVSVYWKLTVPLPAEIVSGEGGVNVPLPEVVLRLTVSGLLHRPDCRRNLPA